MHRLVFPGHHLSGWGGLRTSQRSAVLPSSGQFALRVWMVHLPSLGGNGNRGLGVSELTVWGFLPIWGGDPAGQGVDGHTLKWKFEKDGGPSPLHSPGVDLYRVTSTRWRQACSLQSARLRLWDHVGASQAVGAECPGVGGGPSSEPKIPPGTLAVSLASVQP